MELQYFELLLLEVKEQTEKEISEAVEKAASLKLQKLQSKLDKCIKEKKFLDDVSTLGAPVQKDVTLVSLF